MRVLIIGAYPDSIVSFRGKLIESLVSKGHTVLVAAAPASSKLVREVEALGAQYYSYDVQRNGLNPLADIHTFFQLKKLISRLSPDKILAYTIKPIIWGGLAVRLSKPVEFYPMITGLGYAFSVGSVKRNIINFIVKRLYRSAMRSATAAIFQNDDNLQVFVDNKLILKHKCFRVFGSGVDTRAFSQQPFPETPATFLLIARLLGDKGIREYVNAARKVKKEYPFVRFQLLGPYDSSPDGISCEEIESWQREKVITYLGETKDVIPFLQKCHVYTLPSYHEGIPRTVLEAMAIGRPILTTIASGCRDTVIEGENGFKVPVKDCAALYNRMIWFIENQNEWQRLADNSRNFVCEFFDVDKVNVSINKIIGC